MLRERRCRALVWAAAIVSFTGLTAPFFPPAELTSHFRPFVLIACIIAVPAVISLGRSVEAAALIALSLANVVLFGLPFPTAARSVAVETGRVIKVVSFNTEHSSRNNDRIVAYLEDVRPDIVLFQEILPGQAVVLFDRLKSDFPSQVFCPPKSGCILGLLAKAPMIASGYNGSTETVPPRVWADFARPSGQPLRVVGLHLAFPLMAYRQARQVETLVRDADRQQPTILAGDFNLTPWSWLLNKLIWTGGLRRHGLLDASWPAGLSPAIVPFLLIDNVLTSVDIRSLSFAAGPDLGSDHRPIVVVLVLP